MVCHVVGWRDSEPEVTAEGIDFIGLSMLSLLSLLI